MISAKEALQLDTARLSVEQIAQADKLEADIDTHVRKRMERRGVDFHSEVTDPNVVAEVNQRLIRAGYEPSWRFLIEKHSLNHAIQKCVGVQLGLRPKDAAYL